MEGTDSNAVINGWPFSVLSAAKRIVEMNDP